MCNPVIQDNWEPWQEDQKFKASLDNLGRPCLKTKNGKKKQKKPKLGQRSGRTLLLPCARPWVLFPSKKGITVSPVETQCSDSFSHEGTMKEAGEMAQQLRALTAASPEAWHSYPSARLWPLWALYTRTSGCRKPEARCGLRGHCTHT